MLPDRDEILGALSTAMFEFQLRYAQTSRAVLHDEGDCIRFQTPIDFPLFGGVAMTRFDDASANRRIAEVMAAIRDAGKPQAWVVAPTSRPADLSSRLVNAGAQQIVELAGMVVELDKLAAPPTPPADVRIVQAEDEGGVRDYARIFPLLFNTPQTGWINGLVEVEAEIFKSGEDPFHRYVAYENGAPVCAGMTMACGKAAALQTLCTLPSGRNRGIGAALATQALRDERARGCTIGVLWAGPGADRLYERMGFRRVATCTIFLA